MDRTQAFAEYAHILKDAKDWLSDGYQSPPENISIPQLTQSPLPKHVITKEPLISTKTMLKIDDGISDISLTAIATTIRTCHRCDLALVRNNTVPGIGDNQAKYMIITPAPADESGEKSSPLPPLEQEYLEKWLSAIKIDTSRDVFITPAVKCRTPGGRPPHEQESTACLSFLHQQYKILSPHGILALGSAACGALTGSARDFSKLVAQDWTWGAVPALVLWSPAEVLANPGRLRKPVWEALQRFKVAMDALHNTGV